MTRLPAVDSPPCTPGSFPSSEGENGTPTASSEHIPELEPESESAVEAKPKAVPTPSSNIAHNVHFSFGPNRSYFMNLRNRWWL
jgi:hypothetical protein